MLDRSIGCRLDADHKDLATEVPPDGRCETCLSWRRVKYRRGLYIGASSAGMKSVGLGLSLLPAIFLAVLVIWGLIYRPLFAGLPAIPLQAIFLLSASFAIGQLLLLGFSWDKIQKSIIERISGALPAIFILILIGPC